MKNHRTKLLKIIAIMLWRGVFMHIELLTKRLQFISNRWIILGLLLSLSL